MAKKKEAATKTNPIVIGKPPSQQNGPYWRTKKGNVTEQMEGLPKPKIVSYLKCIRGSHGGSKLDISYWKTLSNGYMVFVNTTDCKIGVVQGFGGNTQLQGATKKEFDTHFKKVLKLLQ